MKPGRPPALTPEQVLEARRLARLPTATRPRRDELAARFGVDPRTVYKALRGLPPYDFGEPVPPYTRARDRRYEAEQRDAPFNYNGRRRRARVAQPDAPVIAPVWAVFRGRGGRLG